MTSRPELSEPLVARLERNGLIIVRGTDAAPFLQGQLTCDVTTLSPGRAQHGGCCTAKGRLLANFLIWRQEDGFGLLVAGGQCAAVHKQLSKFILRSKVEVIDASASCACVGVSGADAAAVAGSVLHPLPANPYDVAHAQGTSIIRLPGERYAILVAAPRAGASADALGHHAASASADTWNWLDVRAGIPEISPLTQEEFVPQMVNLDLLGGISFTKGCYTGQEIVARMHYLGRLKQRMYLAHLAVDAAPGAGDKLYSTRFGDQACGTILRSAPAPDGGYDALAVVQIEEARDANVHWRTVSGPTLAFLQMPYPLTAS